MTDLPKSHTEMITRIGELERDRDDAISDAAFWRKSAREWRDRFFAAEEERDNLRAALDGATRTNFLLLGERDALKTTAEAARALCEAWDRFAKSGETIDPCKTSEHRTALWAATGELRAALDAAKDASDE